MDFEKAYKNLVAKVKNAHLFAQTDSTKNVLEDILPELRESDNERIRKKCIELIKRVIPSGDTQSQESKEILDCIAYLEKQKEPTTEELYAEAGTTEKEYIANTMKMVRAMREKKQEQKPAEKQDYSGLNDPERAIHRGILSAGVENVPVTIIKETAQECLAQMKPAWSEEDEKNLKQCIEIVRGWEIDYDYANPHYSNWLKSLRPSWKPSEEQMDALIRCIAPLEHKYYCILSELYEQLKKL